MMRADEIKITKSKQLLVEGKTPLLFFGTLLKYLQLSEIDVQNFGSNEELKAFLQVFVARPEFKDKVTAFAIIRDAEQLPVESAFQSIGHSIRVAGHEPPKQLASFEGQNPKIGIYILPNCTDTGMLETLCLESVMTNQLSNCIDAYFNCVGSAGVVMPANKTKALTRAFLATQNIDEAQVGRAAQKGIWKWDHAAFQKLHAFLKAF